MVKNRHMQKMMRQILRNSEAAITKKFKVKFLDIHTYTEKLVTEICTQTRLHASNEDLGKVEKATTISYFNLQEVLDDILNDDDGDDEKGRCEEMVQALSTIIQEPVEDQIEESVETQESIEDNSAIKQEMPDFQTLMELSLDNEELKEY